MASTSKSAHRSRQPLPFRALKGVLVALAYLAVAYIGVCMFLLTTYTVVDPPLTGVQLQRHVEAWASGQMLGQQYSPVSRNEISPHLRHAVIAAEDGRFFSHGGIDWDAVQQAIHEQRRRGGSTITQQLVKNLFMTTHSTYIRKAFEVPLTYYAELILGKERILELYLNVVEWDDGIFGAEAASVHYYGISASQLSRYQAAGLAACLPNPRDRSPGQMSSYTNTILVRMGQMGW